MAGRPIPGTEPRRRLTRERVLEAALASADADGLEALSMRKLAEALGVAPMALYRHVANREDLVDGLIDLVFAEIDRPVSGDDWRPAMRRRAISLYGVLLRHRWAIGLMEARVNPGPANLGHHDAVIGNLRAAGFAMAMIAHAYSLLDGYIYGFALTKMNIPFVTPEEVDAVAQSMLEPFPMSAYPNLAAFVEGHIMKPGYDFGDEFEYGLDLILDSLDREHPSA
ncbi:MAG: TetR/AcrR family transcriptional regulator C-terminal domain-containing protein [Chloroflexota bacterium]|nr:TetR/AcrR family transcriptional regulator C-terminal domain-containing protein [Chloroflexota bacterium]